MFNKRLKRISERKISSRDESIVLLRGIIKKDAFREMMYMDKIKELKNEVYLKEKVIHSLREKHNDKIA